MIILDTNVLSEPTKSNYDPVVFDWIDSQIPESLYFTAVGLAEIYVGLNSLPSGKRKESLAQDISELLEQLFAYRILPFDADSALIFANLVVKAKSEGKSVSLFDAQTAAIAKCNGFTVATRDVRPFIYLGVSVINPWTQATS